MRNSDRALQPKLNLLYALIQGFYWMLYCTVIGYASVFLLDQGYTNAQIGGMLGAGFLCSIFLQQYVAGIADRTKRLSLIAIVQLGVLGLLICCGLLMVLPPHSWGLTAAFVLALILEMLLQPLVNALNFYLERLPVRMNFGAARSVGSLLYSGVSLLVGLLLQRWATALVPTTSVVLSLGLLLLLSLLTRLTRGRSELAGRGEGKTGRGGPQTGGGFFRRYPGFAGFLLGGLGLFFGHTLINNYFFQIVVSIGGDSSDMGAIQAFAALMELPAMIGFLRLQRRFGCNRLLKGSALVFLAKIGLTLLAGSLPMLWVSMVLQGLSFALYIPGSVHYVNQIMDDSDAVKGQAFVTAAITLGNLLSSLTGGLLLDYGSVTVMLTVGLAATLVGTAMTLRSLGGNARCA
ncbi:MAG: MFS transporter [Candidatus Onthomonas sp.]